MKTTKRDVLDKLKNVLDPELHISIVDLGLVYDVILKDKKVKVNMTLTTLGCPLFSVIEDEVKNKVSELGIEKEDIKVSLTFDPPWSMDRMSESAKAIIGI